MSAVATELSLLAILVAVFFLNAWLVQNARQPATSDDSPSPGS